MRKILLALVGLVGSTQLALATDCPSATVIPAAPTLPYTQTLVCGTTNDITSSNVSNICGSGSYYGGNESVYVWTPTSNYSGVSIAYSGVSWTGIMLYQGCPTSGGTCVGNTQGSATSKTLNVAGTITAGVTYYIVFDTWPTPNDPCGGGVATFTLNGTIILPCTAPPTAGSVSAANNPICPSVNNNLTLTGGTSGTGQTYQWQSSTTGAAGSYTNIPGATAVTYTSSQTTNTYYRCYVTCSGMSDTTAALLVNTNSFLNCYCTSNATSTADEEILNVTVGTVLNNTSTCSSTGGPGSIQNEYSNYSNLPATDLVRGASYPLSVQIGTCGGNYNNTTRVYIDFNQNGLFTDAGETVFAPAYVNGPHVGSGTLTIPVGATLGQTRMRVVNVETTGTVNPCGTYSWGETEDYIVNIICPSLTGTGAVDQGICSGSAATFTGTPSYSGATISWWDSPTGGTQLGTGNSYTTPTLSSTTPYYVQEDYTGCPSSSRATVTAIVTAVSVTLAPVNITCNGALTGSFTQTAVNCGTGPFTYSMDNGVTFGAIPTNLGVGTYFVVVKDATNALSAPIQVIITQAAAPSALNATNVTYFNATLGWTANGTESSWTVIYGPAGFDPATSGTSVPNVTNPYTISGLLSANTAYEFYVMTDCGPLADTSGPLAFSTDPGFLAWDNSCTSFIDISTTGTNLNTTDDSNAGVTLPWPWNFNGTTVNTITVGNNGGILFNTLVGYVGYTASGNGLYPYNQDLNTPLAGGGVFWQSIGTAPNRQFVIEWKDLAHYTFPAATDGSTFELIYDEATSEVYFLYQDVMMGNTSWDNGADAEIKAITANGSATVSANSSTYLASNSCVHFYNALCPNITNFSSIIYANDALLSWNAGLYGETNWTLIYGPQGFDPTVPGQAIDTFDLTYNSTDFAGTLNQLTTYDVYIYSECQADNLTSGGYFYEFTTLPFCSNPSALAGTSDVDSLELTWNWTASDPTYPVTSFNVQYGMNGLAPFTVVANGINNADTIYNAALLAGGVYQVYIQAECAATNDTSSWVGPITVIMPLSNDTVCGAETLALGSAYTFNNVGAGVSVNETNIAPPATGAQTTTGWANSTLNNTTWFTFVAPASGSVRVNNTAISYNGQAAVYDVTDCGDFNSNFLLVAANDDAIGGTSQAPNFTICGLTPGNTYYLMHDGSGTTGNYSIMITPIVLEAGSAAPLTKICTGSSIDLFSTINGNDANGVWSAPVAAANASISGSTFNSTGLGYQVFNFQYRMTDGCAYDSIVSQVQVYPPSSAGNDGSITACKNEPIDLLSGLSGTVDVDGTWYDPSTNPISSSSIHTSQFQGSYNYVYITGNGVCPDDTSHVVVTVLATCDFLSVQEATFEGVQLYPNPTTGIINISADKAFVVNVTDANGRTVKADFNSTIGITTIDLSKVQVGVYFVTLKNEGASKVFRVVVQ